MPNQPTIQADQRVTQQADSSIIVCGVAPMTCESESKHIREVEIKLSQAEVTFDGIPHFSATVFPAESRPLNPNEWNQKDFYICDVIFRRESGHLICKVFAANIWDVVPSDLQFACNYVISGTGI